MKTTMRAGAAALSLMLGCAAHAQDGYEAHYAAYAEAQAAGDDAAMLTHAEAAWRAARDELGPSDTAALLAQNRLYLTLWSGPADSAAAAAYALELGRAGHGLSNMTLSELVVADAYARASASPSEAGAEEVMRAVLADRETGRPLGPFAAMAYRGATALAMRAGAMESAYVLATSLAKEAEPLDGEEALFAEATLNRGVARVMTNQRLSLDRARGRIEASADYKERLSDAYVLFDLAADAVPPAASLDEIEPVTAQAVAWRSLVEAMGLSLRVRRMQDHVFEGHKVRGTGTAMLAGPNGRCDARDIDWRNRALGVPRSFGEGTMGAAAVFGFVLHEDGTVTAPRLLAEVPGDVMNDRTIRQIGKWRADPDTLPPPCVGEQTLTYRINAIQR